MSTERQEDQPVAERLRAERTAAGMKKQWAWHELLNSSPSILRGAELIATVPAGVSVVAMLVHKGRVVVATSEGVYALGDDDKLVPLEFAVANGGFGG